MGACACSERSVYFESRSTGQKRTEMLIQYLNTPRLTVKHDVSSGEEGDDESGTEDSPFDSFKPDKLHPDSEDEGSFNLPVPRLFSPLNAMSSDYNKQPAYLKEARYQDGQPSLTMMSEESFDHYAVVEDKQQALPQILSQECVTFTRLMRPTKLKLETHSTRTEPQPVEQPMYEVTSREVVELTHLRRPRKLKPEIHTKKTKPVNTQVINREFVALTCLCRPANVRPKKHTEVIDSAPVEEQRALPQVISREFVTLTRLRRPAGVKPERHTEVVKHEPVEEQKALPQVVSREFVTLTRLRRPAGVKPEKHTEVIEREPVEEVFVKVACKPVDTALQERTEVVQTFSVYEEDYPQAKISLDFRDSMRVHYLRSPAPTLTRELYERNLRGSLTQEEEWEALPESRNSVKYSPVETPDYLRGP
jgi:hypothetical protein